MNYKGYDGSSPDTEVVEPSLERSFGKYQLERKIAAGGMAEIYLATLKTDPNSTFAIKKILPHYTNDPQLIAMLINEGKVMLSLRHPNIVPIYDFGKVGETYYLAMEFVRGIDLKNLINRCRKNSTWIPAKLCLHIMMEILEGLAYAHKRRDNFNRPLEIVHRDISPQNIIISDQGEIKILDFGIAKVRGSAIKTQTGMLKGKFSYMSPEQAAGGKVDRRTDLFSAGIVLYELLTLENPFIADQEMKILERIKRTEYRSPRSINADIPKSVEKLIAKVLKRRLMSRFSWAEDFQRHVFKIQKKELGLSSAVELKQFTNRLISGASAADGVTELASEVAAKEYQFARKERTTDLVFIRARRYKRLKIILSITLGLTLLVGMVYGIINYRSSLQTSSKAIASQIEHWWQDLRKPSRKVAKPIVKTPPAPLVEPTPVEPTPKNMMFYPNLSTLKILFSRTAQRSLDAMSFDQAEQVRNSITDQLMNHLQKNAKDGLQFDKKYKARLGRYQVQYEVAFDAYSIEVTAFNLR